MKPQGRFRTQNGTEWYLKCGGLWFLFRVIFPKEPLGKQERNTFSFYTYHVDR